jgi:hypothetical protein
MLVTIQPHLDLHRNLGMFTGALNSCQGSLSLGFLVALVIRVILNDFSFICKKRENPDV